MVKKNKKAIFSGLIGLTLFSPILIVGLSSCSQSTTSSSNESEQKELDEIKNNLLSLNVHNNWSQNLNVTYLSGYQYLIGIENYTKAKDLYQDKISLKWYKDNVELPEYTDVASIECNKSGSYDAKIFYVPLNKELMSFESFNFSLLETLSNIQISLSDEFLSDTVHSITAKLINIPSAIPNNQYTIKWYKNGVEQSSSNSFNIVDPGVYGWKIINNKSNSAIAENNFQIEKKTDSTVTDPPANISWNDIALSFTTNNNINVFDYNHQNIGFVISGLPSAFFSSNRYQIRILKDNTDITNSIGLNNDETNKQVSFDINYKTGAGIYTYKIVDSQGSNSFTPTNSQITLTIGDIANLSQLNIHTQNSGIITNGNPISSSINISNCQITDQQEFLYYYHIEWIKVDSTNTTIGNDVFTINVSTAGSYICKVTLKSNNSISRSIDFKITEAQNASIQYSTNSPKTIIGNSIDDTYNVFTLSIFNFDALNQQNYLIYLNETQINSNTTQINVNNLKDSNNKLRLILNNVEIQSYSLDNLVETYKTTLYLDDNNLTFYDIDPELTNQQQANVSTNTSTFKTLTRNSIKGFLYNKYSKLNIQSNMLTGFKSSSTDVPTTENKNPMGLPRNLDPYQWTGIFQQWNSLTEVNIVAPNFKYLDKSSFYDCPNLTKVNIESDQIFQIENYAFRDCTKLAYASMPTKVEYIGTQAFLNDSALSNFTFSPYLKSLNLQSFKNSGITSVDISQNKKISIGTGAFNNCTKLSEVIYYGVNIEDVGDYSTVSKISEPGLAIIGESAFENCGFLNKFYPSNKITNVSNGQIYLSDYIILGKNNFRACVRIENILHYPEKMPNVPPGLFADSSLGNFTFTNNIKTIGINAFGGILSNNFRDIVIPNSVTIIEHEPFAGSHISSISLPSSLEQLGIRFLSDCGYVKNIKINFDHISLTDDNSLTDDDVVSLSVTDSIKNDIFAGLFIDQDDPSDPLIIEFGENVLSWNDAAPASSNKIYLTLQEFLYWIKEGDPGNTVQFKCHSDTLKQQLISAGFLANNITVL